VSKESIL